MYRLNHEDKEELAHVNDPRIGLMQLNGAEIRRLDGRVEQGREATKRLIGVLEQQSVGWASTGRGYRGWQRNPNSADGSTHLCQGDNKGGGSILS